MTAEANHVAIRQVSDHGVTFTTFAMMGPLTKGEQAILDAQSTIMAARRARRLSLRRLSTSGDPDGLLARLQAESPDDPRFKLPDVATLPVPEVADASLDRMAGSGIYLFDWLGTPHTYVGQSGCIAPRIGSHVAELVTGKHGNRLMQAAFDECGTAGMRARVLELCDTAVLDIREQQWIRRLRPTLNIAGAACPD